MMRQLYWLSDRGWERLEPLSPRGRRGARRVDDGRVISGIGNMLRSGARWRDCPPEYGPYTTVYNRFNRWSRQGLWFDIFEVLTARQASLPARPLTVPTSKHTARQRAEKGAFREAIGRSRGGRTTKIHALTDEQGRPRVLLLSPGNVNDIAMASTVVSASPANQASHRRQGLRRQRPAPASRRSRGQGRHSLHRQQPPTDRLQQDRLSPTQSHRTDVRSPQRLPPHCDPPATICSPETSWPVPYSPQPSSRSSIESGS